MSGYLKSHTDKVFGYIEKQTRKLGSKCDRYLENVTPRQKYVCELLLRVPMIFIIHQWLLLSPYSSYWLIETFLFVVRYGVALFLAGMWLFNTGVLLQIYPLLIADILVAWARQISYWTYQYEAYQLSHEKNVFVWTDLTDRWWTPAILSTILQITYLYYRIGAFAYKKKVGIDLWAYLSLLATLFPYISSMSGVLSAYMSDVSYWLSCVQLTTVCLMEDFISVVLDEDVDEAKLNILERKAVLCYNEQMKSKHNAQIREIKLRSESKNRVVLPEKHFLRDLFVAFGVLYMCISILIEIIIYQRPLITVVSFNSALEMLATWCNSQIIILSMMYTSSMLCNMSVAICIYFVTGEINIIDALGANIGSLPQITTLIAFLETDILNLGYTDKLEALKMALFLSVYAIFIETMDFIQRKILHVINSGSSQGFMLHLRFWILTALCVTVPSLLTHSVSEELKVDPWILFFASGNCSLLVNTFYLLLDYAISILSWYITENLNTLEHFLHYFRMSRGICIITLITIKNYNRYMCPFFKGWWGFRVLIEVVCVIAAAYFIAITELARYYNRNRIVSLLNNLPDVNFKKEDSNHDGEHECSICFAPLKDGKILPCAHSFHRDCLMRWFQVKVVCPYCNTDVPLTDLT